MSAEQQPPGGPQYGQGGPQDDRPAPVYQQSGHEETALRIARWLVWLTYAFLVVATIILLIAFVLLATDANESASFVEWVYRSADRLLQPFRSIYPQIEHGNGSIIDFSILF